MRAILGIESPHLLPCRARPRAVGQEDVELERPAPPALEDFEKDENKDGIPDGWYNGRAVVLATQGGKVGPHYLKFEVSKPGRP